MVSVLETMVRRMGTLHPGESHSNVPPPSQDPWIEAHRLVAIRTVLETLWLQRHYSPRCASTAGVNAVCSEAVEEIRRIVDPGWRPEESAHEPARAWTGIHIR